MRLSRKRAERALTNGLLRELSPLGFVEIDIGAIARPRGSWCEGFFVQMSSPPAQEVCIVAGVEVPLALEFASGEKPKTFSIAVGGRLSKHGINRGDQWFRLGTDADVEATTIEVANLFRSYIHWFEQFECTRDIAESFFENTDLRPLGQNDYWKQLQVFNYACLLLASGEPCLAMKWFQETDRAVRSGERLDKDDRELLERVALLLKKTNGGDKEAV